MYHRLFAITTLIVFVAVLVSGSERRGAQTGPCVEVWDPTFGNPGTSPDGNVFAMKAVEDTSAIGGYLYAGGAFLSIDGVSASKIARWDGSAWDSMGTGITHNAEIQWCGLGARVTAIEKFNAELYVGGNFAEAGGILANNIAKWNGSDWSVVGGGTDACVLAFSEFDDGSGPALYAGGNFQVAGGYSALKVARWNGSDWSAVGSGLTGGTIAPAVEVLLPFDDGTGPALYAGGDFQGYEGNFRNGIARWTGARWDSVGVGFRGHVYALAVFDDGGGDALYAGGGFILTVDSVVVNRIARWNGSEWLPLGDGVNGIIWAMTVCKDGTGTDSLLYVAGGFDSAGGIAASGIATWDGSTWMSVGDVTAGGQYWLGVRALEVFNGGFGEWLYLGGDFDTAGGYTAHNIARCRLHCTVPVLIRLFSARLVDGSVELNWDVELDAPVRGYRILRGTGSDGREITLNSNHLIPREGRRYVDQEVTAGNTYHYRLTAINTDGSEVLSSKASVTLNSRRLALFQNCPNPFNPVTTIRFDLPEAAYVQLDIFDVNGAHVRNLTSEILPAAAHVVKWDGKSTKDARVGSAVYFYRLKTGGKVLTKKMVLIR